MRVTPVRFLAAALLALHLGGCYGYAVTTREPRAGEQLRARLSSTGSAWLLENLGRSRSTVDGTFIRTDADRLVLAAWRADLPATQQFRAAIDTLRIPREHVVAIEQRRLSIGRTAALVAVGTGIVVLAVSELAGIGGNGDGGDGGTTFLVVPLRLPIGH